MRTYNNVMDKNQDIIFLSKHLSKLLEKSLDETTQELGLTPQQGRILWYLLSHEEEKIKQVDIERKFSLSKSTVSGLIKRMLYKKLISRDKKDKHLMIAPEGRKIMDDFKKCNETLRENLLKDFSKEEQSRILQNLYHMIDIMEGGKNERKD